MKPVVRVVGVGKPLPIEHFGGRLPSGQFKGGPFVSFDSATCEGLDFSRRRFTYFACEGSTFIDCDFSGVKLDTGSLDASRTSTFKNCRFDRIRPGATIWGVSRFESCFFEDVRLKDWRPQAAEFVDCRFSGRLDGVVFSGSPPWPYNDRMVPRRTHNEFRGNDFSRVDLRFPDFRFGVTVAANQWPTGPEYLQLDRWQERLHQALSSVATWVDDAERERALWWLRFQRTAGREQQAEIVMRTLDWDLEPQAIWPRLWVLLAAPL